MKNLIKITFITVLILIFLGNTPKQNKDEKGKIKPNIIFVVVDDLGWRDVGFMGSRFYETPNIDRIARGGIIFTNSYSSCAVCSPSRASLLTGRYPARMGITDWIRGSNNGSVMPANGKNPAGYEAEAGALMSTPVNALWMESEEVTLAEVLKKEGYTTAHIGKWHLGFDDWFPEKQGFDVNKGGVDFGEPPSYFDPYEAGKSIIKNLPSRSKGEYLTDREGDEAVEFIRENKDKPFYLNMWHYAVHTPLEAKKEMIGKYLAKTKADTTMPKWNEERDGMSAHFKTKEPMRGQRNPTYAAMIESVDQSFGRIIRTLAEEGVLDNTIIVFTSDNGGHIVSTDNSPARMGKGHPYEGGIRVPLAIYYPKMIRPHMVNKTRVMGIDIFPTLLTMTGTEYKPENNIDGKDLSSLFDKQGSISERDLFWHYPHYWWGMKVKPYSIIISGDFKLIRNYEDQSFELYDLKNDFSESNNLAYINHSKVRELNVKLSRWLKSVKAKLPYHKDNKPTPF